MTSSHTISPNTINGHKHTICAIPIFDDNYVWLIHDDTHAWVIDPGQATPIVAKINALNLTLKGIFITHSHWDHVNGINELISLSYATEALPVYGPANIHPSINRPVSDGDTLKLNGLTLEVWHTPGHMAEHLSFYCPQVNALFCGDTLFSAGCGRLKQTGDIQQLFNSLNRIQSLPPQTQIFCAHEYTQSNLQFAQTVEPNNSAVGEYIKVIEQLRKNNQPSIPSTLATELACNPFLRTHKPAVIEAVVKASPTTTCNTATCDTTPLAVFTALRNWKDTF
ncbi:hydroxyacylglutathione hydrolase [Marinagarivorans algicola]|uniref:hydroxyacylglutathione hydrolase n=1 Tax=Marinagarivorans algicola TaxID=1513270 RepID=UPI0006B548EB|nr:hydroxyacylglutathione hydrolase [Marinagarivorans algicola]